MATPIPSVDHSAPLRRFPLRLSHDAAKQAMATALLAA